MKTFLRGSILFLAFLTWAVVVVPVPAAFGNFVFAHPGLLQSREDLERIKIAVERKEEPIYSGYQIFRANPQSQLSYQMRGPMAMVGRNPTVGQIAYDSDANAAYQCSIQWCITGDIAYAKKAEAIIDAWSATLKSITGRDAVLMAGLGPFKMVNAAELLRYTDGSWPQTEIRRAEDNFREVVYPVIKDFAPFANGNWDTAAMKTMMAIGVFSNDRAMFERALDYYVDGAGDGRLTHYIINDAGQCQESGRDQQHTQLGLAHLGDCCEIAWHQGLNLYGYDGNLLLRGFEYAAKYNLGEDVPFAESWDRTGKYHHSRISANGRRRFRSIYEEIYNAYANRMEVPAPFTKQVIERIRPEGPGVFDAPNGADHVGFGTLLFAATKMPGAAPVQNIPAAPAGILATGSTRQVQLTWIDSLGAGRYTITRTTKSGERKVIDRNVSTNACTDSNVISGEIYSYVITAANSTGESPQSLPVSVCAGLPKPWTHEDVGHVPIAGDAAFDGQVFKVQGAGKNIGGTSDEFQFVCRPIDGGDTIVARFVPQTSSQFSQFGLMMRESMEAGAPNVSLLISPRSAQDREAPDWRVELSARKTAAAEPAICAGGEGLLQPAVTFGRLTGFVWLKLRRSGSTFIGSISLDGKDWKLIGRASVALKQQLLAGLAVCSGLPKAATTMKFDHISFAGDGAQEEMAGKQK